MIADAIASLLWCHPSAFKELKCVFLDAQKENCAMASFVITDIKKMTMLSEKLKYCKTPEQWAELDADAIPLESEEFGRIIRQGLEVAYLFRGEAVRCFVREGLTDSQDWSFMGHNLYAVELVPIDFREVIRDDPQGGMGVAIQTNNWDNRILPLGARG